MSVPDYVDTPPAHRQGSMEPWTSTASPKSCMRCHRRGSQLLATAGRRGPRRSATNSSPTRSTSSASPASGQLARGAVRDAADGQERAQAIAEHTNAAVQEAELLVSRLRDKLDKAEIEASRPEQDHRRARTEREKANRTGGGTAVGRGGPALGRSLPKEMPPQLPLRLPVQWEPFHQRDVPWPHGSMYQPGGHAGPGDGATVLCLCHRARSSVSTPIRAAPRKATLRRIMEVARVPAERAPPSGARRARLASHPHNIAAPRNGAAAAAHHRDGPVPSFGMAGIEP